MTKDKTNKNLYITEMGLLIGVLILMSFTPFGYLKIGIVSITFNTIPVVIGAITLGTKAGAILGGVFGLTSLFQCVFAMDAFGTALFQINPWYTAIMCIVPRIFIGVVASIVYKGFKEKKALSYGVACAAGSATNTVLFVSALVLFFGNTEYIKTNLGSSIIKVVTTLVTFNSLIELVICTLMGGAVASALCNYIKHRRKK